MLETGSNYYAAWVVYLLAAMAAQLFAWRWTRDLKSVELRTILRQFCLALIITPALLDPGQNYWVPAFITVVMEGLNSGSEAAISRAQPILIVMVALFVSSFAWRVYRARK